MRKVRVCIVGAAVLCSFVVTSQAGWAAPGPPSAPRSVTLVPGNGRVTVSWVAPFSNGDHPVTNYEVIAYHHDVRLAINVFHSTKLTEPITGLKNGSAYTFTVGARNAAGWSRLSARSTAITAGAPVAPAKPSAVPGDGRVTISWHAANDNGFSVDEYRVTPYINGSPGAARVFKTAQTRQDVGGLQNGKPYSFKVAAHNRNGWSDASVNSSIAVPGK